MQRERLLNWDAPILQPQQTQDRWILSGPTSVRTWHRRTQWYVACVMTERNYRKTEKILHLGSVSWKNLNQKIRHYSVQILPLRSYHIQVARPTTRTTASPKGSVSQGTPTREMLRSLSLVWQSQTPPHTSVKSRSSQALTWEKSHWLCWVRTNCFFCFASFFFFNRSNLFHFSAVCF